MKSTLVALFLLAACAGSPQSSSNANLTSERDPACATCPPDCCEGEKAEAVKTSVKTGCCAGEATEVKTAMKTGCCAEQGAAAAPSCCAPAATAQPKQ